MLNSKIKRLNYIDLLKIDTKTMEIEPKPNIFYSELGRVIAKSNQTKQNRISVYMT